ncbi:MAG TPA: ParB/RepB/Spo0J family partition protein [Rhodospirillales bacterium]|nr:ParB/RepB/Spo0J family partition protein [Rhodospirillales bacterium]
MAPASRRGLGRGLSALLGEDGLLGAGSGSEEGVRLLPIESLEPSPLQPRRQFGEEELAQLADSLRRHGVLQPLLVRPSRGAGGGFEIVAGERRWRAAQKAGIFELPVVVRELEDREVVQLALVENLQREDLDPLEEAEAYRRLIEEFGHTQEEVAQAVGRSRSHVANTLRLLTLPAVIRGMLRAGRITAGHARALLAASDPAALAEMVVARGLNVRRTEELARAERERSARRRRSPPDPDVEAAAESFRRLLGLEVTIRPQGRGGRLIIRYSDPEQLENLRRRLAG